MYDGHMPNKEITDFVRCLRRQGFDIERTKSNHYKIRRDGRVVATLPSTPGGGGQVLRQILRREMPKLIAAGFDPGTRRV